MLAPGDVYVNADFGYEPTAGSTIGDLIYLDANGDGTYDMGEPGIAGRDGGAAGRHGQGHRHDDDGRDAAPTASRACRRATYTVWVNDTANVLGELAQTGDPDATLDSKHHPDGRRQQLTYLDGGLRLRAGRAQTPARA